MKCYFPNCKCNLEDNGHHVCPEGLEHYHYIHGPQMDHSEEIKQIEKVAYDKGYAKGLQHNDKELIRLHAIIDQIAKGMSLAYAQTYVDKY